MYEVDFLPIARSDLAEIARYIAVELHAPQAADDLIEAIDCAVGRLREFPCSCKVYRSAMPRTYEYRMLPVKNYILFYTVIEESKKVEIHRAVYMRRDFKKLLPPD